MLAAMNLSGVALIALGGLVLLLSIATLVVRHRVKRQAPEVPIAMRPGPSDQALETPLLLKLQGWGVVLILFFVAWFPVMWLIEPSRNVKQEEDLQFLALERGAKAVMPFSEENQLGVGCTRCHGPELKGGVIATKNGYAYPPNLTTICAGPFGGHPAIFSVNDIYQVIQEGRPPEDPIMPSWSIRFKGALTDQQINDIVVYLVDQSSKVVPYENNVCLNPDAQQRALDENAAKPPDQQLDPRDV